MCSGATDMVQATAVVEMCLNDERNGWAVPHMHPSQGAAMYQQPELGACIRRANSRIAGTSVHAALALSSGCLSCLVGSPTGTATVLDLRRCFNLTQPQQATCTGAPENAALSSMFGSMDRVKASCHCAVDGCGVAAETQAGCSLALGPVRSAMPSIGAACGGCALNQAFIISRPQAIVLACNGSSWQQHTPSDPCTSVACTPTAACYSAGVCSRGICTQGNRLPEGTQCNDANAETGNDACTSGVCAGTVPAVLDVALTLDMDIATIPPGSQAEASFKTSFADDVARMLTGVNATQIEILRIRAGSVTVEFRINPKAQSSGPVNVDVATVHAAFASTVSLPTCVLATVSNRSLTISEYAGQSACVFDLDCA
jgi:hypothetical protein